MHECWRSEPTPVQPHVEWAKRTSSLCLPRTGSLREARRLWQVNVWLRPTRTARRTPQEPSPLMGLKQPGTSDTVAPQPIVSHQLQYMSSVWFVNHWIQWLFAWEAADRGLGGLARA